MLNYTLNYLNTNLNAIPLIGIELEFYFDNVEPNDISLLITNIKKKYFTLTAI